MAWCARAPQRIDPEREAEAHDWSHRIGPHADGPVCAVCENDLVFPNNGSHTRDFKPCFEKVDEVCATDDGQEHYTFCEAMVVLDQQLAEDYAADGEDLPPGYKGLMHVIEVRSVAT